MKILVCVASSIRLGLVTPRNSPSNSTRISSYARRAIANPAFACSIHGSRFIKPSSAFHNMVCSELGLGRRFRNSFVSQTLANPVVASYPQILFLGDSIVYGAVAPGGYISDLASKVKQLSRNRKTLLSGLSMLGRWTCSTEAYRDSKYIPQFGAALHADSSTAIRGRS